MIFIGLCVPRVGIAGAYGHMETMFNILRSCQTAFQSGCIILQSHRQFLRILVYPHSCQHLLSFVLFSMAPGPGEECFLDPQLTYLGVLDSSVLGFPGVIKRGRPPIFVICVVLYFAQDIMLQSSGSKLTPGPPSLLRFRLGLLGSADFSCILQQAF